jgi:hypothetical protein
MLAVLPILLLYLRFIPTQYPALSSKASDRYHMNIKCGVQARLGAGILVVPNEAQEFPHESTRNINVLNIGTAAGRNLHKDYFKYNKCEF